MHYDTIDSHQVECSSSLATILSRASVAALRRGRVLVVFGSIEVGPMLTVVSAVDPLEELSAPVRVICISCSGNLIYSIARN